MPDLYARALLQLGYPHSPPRLTSPPRTLGQTTPPKFHTFRVYSWRLRWIQFCPNILQKSSAKVLSLIPLICKSKNSRICKFCSISSHLPDYILTENEVDTPIQAPIFMANGDDAQHLHLKTCPRRVDK